MFGSIFNNWTSFLVVLMGVCYILVIHYLNRRESRPRKLSEDELLVKLAMIENCSEYDIFLFSAGEWHVPESRVNDDFREYLLAGLIPYYVNAYVRKHAEETGGVYRPPFFLRGGGSLPWLE